MEIEDDNSNSNSNMSIYVNTPAVAASAHAPSSQVVTHRPSLLAQLTQPVRKRVVVLPVRSLNPRSAKIDIV